MKDKKILIIEDEKSLREAIHDKLKKEDFIILEAKNGEEGLAVSLKEHPDLILLDLVMPKMDGMSMLKKLREDVWGKTVPVIILTNLPSNDEERNKDITILEPTFYFIKTDKSMEEIINAVEDRLGMIK
jgi:DNA-binding response OmpR family regulator